MSTHRIDNESTANNIEGDLAVYGNIMFESVESAIVTFPNTKGTLGESFVLDSTGKLQWVDIASTIYYVNNNNSSNQRTSITIDTANHIDFAVAGAPLARFTTNSFVISAANGSPIFEASNNGAPQTIAYQALRLATSTGQISFKTPATLESYDLIYPVAGGGAGQVLSNDGLGTLSWVTPVIAGGSTVVAGLAVGTLNSQPVSVITNGLTRLTVTSTGNLVLPDAKSFTFNQLDNTTAVSIKAPNTGLSNYTLTLPTSAGPSGYVMSTDGSGALVWIIPPFSDGSGGIIAASVKTNAIESIGFTLNIATANNTQNVNIGSGTSVQTINLGNTGAGVTTINIGGAGDNVNIAGTLTTVNTTNTQVMDKTLVLNSGGAAGSAGTAGIYFEEAGDNTSSFIRIASDRTKIEMKPPTGILVTLDQSIATTDTPSFVGMSVRGGHVSVFPPTNNTEASIQMNSQTDGTGNFWTIGQGALSSGTGNLGIGSVTTALALIISGTTGFITPTKTITFPSNNVRKRISFYDIGGDQTVNSDHRFNGFGMDTAMLLYQVNSTTDDHVFYAATGAATSNELFRIKGTGAISCSGAISSGGLTTTAFTMATGATTGYVLTANASGVGTWAASGVGNLTGDITSVGLVTTAGPNIVQLASTQTLTNKTIKGSTNSVDATTLRFGSTWSADFAGAAPATNNVLTYNGTNAVWTIPSVTMAGDVTGNSATSTVVSAAGNFTVGTDAVVTGKVRYANSFIRKRVAFWDAGTITDNTAHNFDGIGIASAQTIYQLSATTNDHVFYAATSATASNELLRIKGTGAISCAGAISSGGLTTTGFTMATGAALGSILTSNGSGVGTWAAPVAGNLTGDVTSVGLATTLGNLSGDITSVGRVTTASANIVTLAGTQTLTNKTMGNVTIRGSSQQLYICPSVSNNEASIAFNTASSGGAQWTMGQGAWSVGAGNFGIGYGSLGSVFKADISGTLTFYKNIYMNNAVKNKMIALFDSGTSTDQTQLNFIGFGINGSEFTYNVSATTNDHVFYAATSATASNELLRIKGTGAISCTGAISSGGLTTTGFTMATGATSGYVLTAGTGGVGTWAAPGNLTGDVTSVGLATTLQPLSGDITSVGRVTTAGASIVKTTNAQTLTNKTLGYTVLANNIYVSSYQIKMFAFYDQGVTTNQTQHNFNGFGMTAGIFRYQTDTTDDHVFYAATSATASNELFRIKNAGGVVMVGRLDINTGTTGNMGIGTNTLAANTTGIQNIAVGYHSLAANTNNNNTAIGYNTLALNTTGGLNTAVGSMALSIATTAVGNTAVGNNSMQNATGAANTAVGNNTLIATTGSYNVGCGSSTLSANTSGLQNTAVGTDAIANSTTGSNNTCVGYGSGLTIGTSSNNTCIGAFADVSADTWTNSTAIGNGAIITASNTIQLGDSSVTNIITSGAITCATPFVAFNPSIFGNGAVMHTMTSNCGYILYGRMCFISYDLTWSSTSTSGTVIVNLPFSMVSSSIIARAGFNISYSGGVTLPSPAILSAFVNAGSSNMQLGINNYSTGTITALQIANLSSSGEIQLSGWFTY